MVLYHSADLKDHKLIRLQNLFTAGKKAFFNNFALYQVSIENTSHVLREYHYDLEPWD